jgi:heme/copper-type cytochrome/quinol oxidase subunit 2
MFMVQAQNQIQKLAILFSVLATETLQIHFIFENFILLFHFLAKFRQKKKKQEKKPERRC